jgi:hypothetical protein
MKTTSQDGSFIDYTTGNLGVRVWKNQSRAIARDNESAGWIEQENIFTIPVPNRVLALQRSSSDAPARAIAWNTALLENKECGVELKKLLAGQIVFDQALPESIMTRQLNQLRDLSYSKPQRQARTEIGS